MLHDFDLDNREQWCFTQLGTNNQSPQESHENVSGDAAPRSKIPHPLVWSQTVTFPWPKSDSQIRVRLLSAKTHLHLDFLQ